MRVLQEFYFKFICSYIIICLSTFIKMQKTRENFFLYLNFKKNSGIGYTILYIKKNIMDLDPTIY